MGENKSSEAFLSKLALGHYGLAKTYWLFGFLINGIFEIIAHVVDANMQLDVIGVGTYLVVWLVNLVYFVFWFKGLWRAASVYDGRRLWAILAKISAVLGAVSIGRNVFFTGLVFLQI